MSALGICGCVAFYAICMAFKGWSVSLLICAGKAMDISSSSNAGVRTRAWCPELSVTFTQSYCVHSGGHKVVRWC